MSEKKLLTLCFPTYNRGKYLKMQLERLVTVPSYFWNDLTVFVSDNCSTDETIQIGQKFSKIEGVDIIYSRNEKNLGMDGNFVTCFKAADTKYVWLLGDDDIILIERLGLILKLLKSNEYGLLHLGIKRSEKEDYTEYSNNELFLREIGIWISFISSNIVNAKYVKEINFEKYYGSYFTLIPLYLTALLSEKNNIMVNVPVFDSGKDYGRNGGYNIAQVFAHNYLEIFKEFQDNGLISENTYIYEKKETFDFVMPMVYNFVFRKRASNYKTEGTWRILFREYGIFPVVSRIIKIIHDSIKTKIKAMF